VKRKIAVVTVSRAEYGILKKLLLKLHHDKNVELQLIVTGSHIMEDAGMTINDIKKDNIPIAAIINMELHGDKPEDISAAMGTLIKKMGITLANLHPDLLVVISDRYETCAAALASVPFNIPLAHIAGGVVTQGAIDDIMRHSITKMSHLHFAVDQDGVQNLIKMGEEPWRIHYAGSMSIDLLKESAHKSKEEIKTELNIPESNKDLMLFIYHPVTTEFNDTKQQITNALAALPEDMDIIALLPNQDTSRDIIAQKVTKKADCTENMYLFKHIQRTTYASIMKHAKLMAGNSSSGLLEAPTFKTPTVNIGNRQQGRGRTHNVIETDYTTENIKAAIKKARSAEFNATLTNLTNPFGDGNATGKIFNIITTIPLNKALMEKKLP
jgi:GDP/UDP-N,N'-diacetylbacillosamine 2-epimerase (hydrolysing)